MQIINNQKYHIAEDVEAVVTSFNQGTMLLEAVHSLYRQTMLPSKIFVVDDGSTDENSINILNKIKSDSEMPVPIEVIQQSNSGVSAARNAGISRTQAPLVLVFDGDDRLEPPYIEQVSCLLRGRPSVAAASSWMQTFGVLEAVVCPMGGGVTEFLARNCCPATHILRRQVWEKCGGYDESMRSGFEDWDFFLSMLEAVPGSSIEILRKPFIDYRTAPASANVKSMSKRLELMRFIIEKHIDIYRKHIQDAVLGLEAISMGRLDGWENEMVHTIAEKQNLSRTSQDFLEQPTYGDGGMAAAVRIASLLGKENTLFLNREKK